MNAANTIQAPGYQIVDALAQYAVNSHFTLRLNVNNLTDKQYTLAIPYSTLGRNAFVSLAWDM